MAEAALGVLSPTIISKLRTVDCFEKLKLIGKGSYGVVYEAKDIKTGEIVALKKIRMDGDLEKASDVESDEEWYEESDEEEIEESPKLAMKLPISATREIKILNKLRHDNIIRLKEVVTSSGKGDQNNQEKPGGIYLVLEYMDHDLSGIAGNPEVKLTIPQIKCYMKQLLTGLQYCHENQVLHRDIKCANILIDNKGILKLPDFGLARSFSDEHIRDRTDLKLAQSFSDDDVTKELTNKVVTFSYRPPELLLGAVKYGTAIDMWSVGCVFGKLLTGKTIFRGKDKTDQLTKIYEVCGTPDENNWPGVSSLPWYNKYKLNWTLERRVKETYRHIDGPSLALLEKMLVLDPSQRISAKDALADDYFSTDPLPCDPETIPRFESSHELKMKEKRKQMREAEAVAEAEAVRREQRVKSGLGRKRIEAFNVDSHS